MVKLQDPNIKIGKKWDTSSSLVFNKCIFQLAPYGLLKVERLGVGFRMCKHFVRCSAEVELSSKDPCAHKLPPNSDLKH